LVSAGLIIVSAGVVISAMGHADGVVPRARQAAATDPALVVTGNTPDTVRLRSASRVGDSILLRVDPVGGASARTLIASPGATVTLRTGPVPLQQLIDAGVARGVVLNLEYDAIGQVVSLTQQGAVKPL
jgi:hypothetical protein